MTQSDIKEVDFQELQAAADKGDVEAQFKLGLSYESGNGVRQDERAAALWFKRAAQQRYAPAFTKYGDCLYYGRGVAEDHAKAFEQYLQGATAGESGSMASVAYAYHHGDGTEQDHQSAFNWYQKAAEHGDAEGQNGLAIMYANGLGTEKDLEQATYWYTKAAQQGSSYAMFNLARHYEGPLEDPLEAELWYRKAAEMNHPSAQYELGRMFCYGDGVPRDPKESVHWLRRALLNGYEGEARSKLAWDLRDLPEPAYEESYYWAGFAAALEENAWSKTFVAQLYDEFDNGPMAIFWSNEAHKLQGDDESKAELEKYCSRYQMTIADAIDKLVVAGVNPEELTTGKVTVIFGPDIYPTQLSDIKKPATLLAVEDELFGTWDSAEDQTKTAAVIAERTEAPQTALPEHTVKAPAAKPPATMDPAVQALNLPTSQLPPGTILAEKYLIQSVLGKGGMAIVFKARHLLMDRTVAIKMLLPETSKDEKTVSRFQREAKAASALRHPNVITIYDFGLSPEGQPFIVMDYLQGHSLEDLIEQHGPLPPQRAIPMLLQAADALAAAHEAGILHRDIKPSNIMVEDTLTQKDFVRLVDFGIAKSIGEQDEQQQKLTKTGEVFGSLVYMSPEQCLGKPLDARSDIYSFGCVIFEVLTGVLPFMGDTVFETMSKHIYEAPPDLAPLLREYSNASAIEMIFKRAVEKDPADRFANMNELRRELQSAL